MAANGLEQRRVDVVEGSVGIEQTLILKRNEPLQGGGETHRAWRVGIALGGLSDDGSDEVIR
jgi:hypothetical protein